MVNQDGMPSLTEFQLMELVVVERSGREVAKQYEEKFKRRMSYGTLYTTLRRLKEQDWVAMRDDSDQDGRVRFFKLKGKGVRALNSARDFYRQQFGLGAEVTQ